MHEDEGNVSVFILPCRPLLRWSVKEEKNVETDGKVENQSRELFGTKMTALYVQSCSIRHESSRMISPGIPNFPYLSSRVRTRSKKLGAKFNCKFGGHTGLSQHSGA